jgi:hypothetical protein
LGWGWRTWMANGGRKFYLNRAFRRYENDMDINHFTALIGKKLTDVQHDFDSDGDECLVLTFEDAILHITMDVIAATQDRSTLLAS